MPTSVIKAVEALAERDKQDGNLEFTDRNGDSFADIQHVGDANHTTDGDAGVHEEANAPEHTQQYVNEPEQEDNDTDDEAPAIHMEIPGVTEENIEIPGVIEGVPEDTPGLPEGTTGVTVEVTVEATALCECETELPPDQEPTTNPDDGEQNEPTPPPTEDDSEDENEVPPRLTSRQSTDNEDSDDDEEEEEQGK
jgi:hypothetical protein